MKLYKGVRLLIKYIVMYLSMLMPRNKEMYVFGAWLGEKYADNTKALFECAQKRKKIRTIWISKNKDVVEEVRNLGYEAYYYASLKGIAVSLRAKYVFVTNGISDVNHAFMGNAVFINVWHGVPLKKIGYDDSYARNWDSVPRKIRDGIVNVALGREYVVATSETIASLYESAFRRPKEQILCLGQPRNDVFFKPREKQWFQGKKIILYAPTHRKEGKEIMPLSKMFQLDKWNSFCETYDYYLVIKKHFYHKEEQEHLEQYKRILDVTGQTFDTQLLLMETDILITDYSSIYIDYMLLNRPILFYAYDYETYLKEDRQMYFQYENVTPGPICTTDSQLLEELERCIADRNYHMEKRKEILKMFYCESGMHPVSDMLLDLVEEGAMEKKKKNRKRLTFLPK